ncbi:NAD-binding protein [Auriscalpium vulgare]|uniref:NAD-binding protein n=1 Tax=Auriscalpium vulgare TaxID=40419 RepID=A0ACB8SAA8_9AGAM|nr:NAD-binding protein [Auriscalpium vulgare]
MGRVVVLGATGPSGLLLVRAALAAQHTVVVYARNPSKLPADLAEHPSVTVIKGELEDAPALSAALAGADSVISALGPSSSTPRGTPLAKGYAVVLDAMRAQGVARIVALGTASITDEHDKRDLRYSAMVWTVWAGVNAAWKDIVAVGDVVRGAEDLEWTIVRVPILTNSESTAAHAGYVGDGKSGVTLSRAAFAAFVVGELEKNEWVRKSPLLTSA